MRVDIGGASLAYVTSGDASRPEPPVVLLHGLASTKETFADAARALESDHHVVRPDMRGHGASDAPPGAWSIGDLGRDVVAVLDAIGAERAILAGHSAGGVIALEVAIRAPARVVGLVLAATASQCNQRAGDFYEAMAKKAEEHGGAAVMPDFGWSAEDAAKHAPDATGFAKASRCMATLFPSPLTPELGRIACPTSILVGSNDFIGAGGSVIMSRAIPGATIRILEGRGHGIHLEDPDAFVAAVRSVSRAVRGA